MQFNIAACDLRADRLGILVRIGQREWYWNRIERRLSRETVNGSRIIRRHWTWDRSGLQPKPIEFRREPGCTCLRIGRRKWVWLRGGI